MAPQLDITGDGLIPLPLHDPFAGDEAGRCAEYLAQRIPAPVMMLHPKDAKRLMLSDGAAPTLDGSPVAATLTLSDTIPEGHVGLSVGRVAPRNLGRRVRIGGAS